MKDYQNQNLGKYGAKLKSRQAYYVLYISQFEGAEYKSDVDYFKIIGNSDYLNLEIFYLNQD